MDKNVDKNVDKKGVGKRIHDLRIENYLSMDELSKHIDVSGKSTINNWENGSSIPKQNNLRKLSEYFNVDPKYILYGSLKDYVYNFLTNTVFINNSRYENINKLIWEYAKLSTNVSNEINEFEFKEHELKDNSSKEDVDKYNVSVLKELFNFKTSYDVKKEKAVKKVISSIIDEIIVDLNTEVSNPWNKFNIISITEKVIKNKINKSLGTFKGQIRKTNEDINKLSITGSTLSTRKYNSLEDFLKSDVLSNPEYDYSNDEFIQSGNTKIKLIDEYYKSKLMKLVLKFQDELDRLNNEYDNSVDKYTKK